MLPTTGFLTKSWVHSFFFITIYITNWISTTTYKIYKDTTGNSMTVNWFFLICIVRIARLPLSASSNIHFHQSCKDSCTTVFDSLTSPPCAVFFFTGTLILYLRYLLPLPRMMPTAHKDTMEIVINHQVQNDDLELTRCPCRSLTRHLPTTQ